MTFSVQGFLFVQWYSLPPISLHTSFTLSYPVLEDWWNLQNSFWRATDGGGGKVPLCKWKSLHWWNEKVGYSSYWLHPHAAALNWNKLRYIPNECHSFFSVCELLLLTNCNKQAPPSPPKGRDFHPNTLSERHGAHSLTCFSLGFCYSWARFGLEVKS